VIAGAVASNEAVHVRDAAYDIVLLAHVLAAAAGLVAVLLAGGYAWALLRTGLSSETVRRYYRPGVNWAGRVVFLVPVLGLALMGMSHGDWSFDDAWIVVGLGLWALVAVTAEMALWPVERRLQEAVAAAGPGNRPADGRDPAAGERTVAVVPVVERGVVPVAGPAPSAGLRRECRRVVVISSGLAVLLIAAAWVMVAKP
jgi:uncharacterized membrane protein